MRGAKAELSQLVHALDLMIEASRPQIASRAVRHAIAMLADQNAAEAPRLRHALAPRPNGALPHMPNGVVPDWEPLRQRLHATYRDCNAAQRGAIAGELQISPSSLRNYISTVTPGAGVIARVGQWLEGRGREPEADAEKVHHGELPVPTRERHIRPPSNGANGAAEAAQWRDKLRFLIETDPGAINAAGVGLRVAKDAAEGASVKPEAFARLTRLVRGG
jgi:hypothetical protein